MGYQIRAIRISLVYEFGHLLPRTGAFLSISYLGQVFSIEKRTSAILVAFLNLTYELILLLIPVFDTAVGVLLPNPNSICTFC